MALVVMTVSVGMVAGWLFMTQMLMELWTQARSLCAPLVPWMVRFRSAIVLGMMRLPMAAEGFWFEGKELLRSRIPQAHNLTELSKSALQGALRRANE